ncbi:MAG: hypothetical protein CSYNP_00535 [Syntrophus sp. SKADARSKE-3]|nr:hypothetical protein [Syntrophus sp. SKADARSKE-3]
MVHQRKSLWIMLLVLITLTACAAKKTPLNNVAAGKQAAGPKSYSEIWLDKRTLQIDFKGSMDEQVDKMKAMAVLRAAGIGKEKKYERFVILHTADQTIIDGVVRSGDEFLPIEKTKVSITVKFVTEDDHEFPQAFVIDEKIAEIQKSIQ